MKILILTSNPRKDLNLNEEIRDLKGVIERSRDREQFEVEVGLAVRPEDLQGLLLKHEPQIVHFCGHGTGEQGLVLQDDAGRERLVSTDALKDFFGLFSDKVECVLLNACYSEMQADAIVEHVNYVIGMSQEIRDEAATAFATGFYRALGYGRPIEQSFKLGCNQIHLTILDSGNSPRRSVSQEQRKLEVVNALERDIGQDSIPEHLKPKLKQKSNLTTVSNPVGVKLSEQLSLDENVEIQVNIDRAYDQEIKLKQYRDCVRKFLVDRKLSPLKTIRLKRLREDLGLSVADANQILAEEQAEEQEPIRKAQEDYEEMLIRLIEEGHYPLNAETNDELQEFCQELGLTASEVETISKPILEAAEEDYQQKLSGDQQEPLDQQHSAQQPSSKRLCTRRDVLIWLGIGGATGGVRLMMSASAKSPIDAVIIEDLGGDTMLEMVEIPGGKFLMGSPQLEDGHTSHEDPQHEVTVASFQIGKFEVTQTQWRSVAALPKVKLDLNPDPSRFKGANRPVELVSWDEAVEFCDRLSKKTGKPYRLPSEAEWEYACRAGTTTPFHFGETITTGLANYRGTDQKIEVSIHLGNSGNGSKGIFREQTTDVGSFPPNAFGLYDMHGNVWEWCADPWHENYNNAPADGRVWELASDPSELGKANRKNAVRLLRGGSWKLNPSSCRSACRNRVSPRVATVISVFGFFAPSPRLSSSVLFCPLNRTS
jgi:formylglycine-generating enzyme required for sulfatase activity